MSEYPTQVLKLVDDLFPSLLAGTKRATVRAGFRDIKPGRRLFFQAVSGAQSVAVDVLEVRWKLARDLTDDEARLDGAASAIELRAALLRHYPDLRPGDGITVILHSAVTDRS